MKGSGCLGLPLFTEDSGIKVAEIERHTKWLIEKGTRTIVPGSVCLGCTREEASLIWKRTAKAADGKATVMRYLGPRCNTAAMRLEGIRTAEGVGCDCLYFSVQTTTNVTGYHEHPSFFDQLVEAWRAGLELANLPVMRYNDASPSNGREPNISVDARVQISKIFDNEAGLKTNSPLSGQLLADTKVLKPLGLSIVKGLHETEFIGSLAMGVDGFISITGHALPDLRNGI